MQRYKILWVDDEIELLKPYVLYLEEKKYIVKTFSDPFSLTEYIQNNTDFDLVLVDENMPGKTGLNLINDIKKFFGIVPIIMITKNEEENIMEEAIGSMISDYLIKPLNPNQLLISIKKVLENNSIIKNKLKTDYLNSFNKLSSEINSNNNFFEWVEIYKKIVNWEISLEKNSDDEYDQILISQKKDANKNFSRYIIENYKLWINNENNRPTMSFDLLKKRIFPRISSKPIFFILIDNFRYDQWKAIENYISNYFFIKNDDPYFSILPTTTEYSRNSIFSGLSPLEMSNDESKLWEDKSNGLNNNEFEFIDNNFKRNNLIVKHSYNKIVSHEDGVKFVKKFSDLLNYNFNSIVFNFIDMLSHARSENKLFKNLVYDEKSFRSFTLSWLKNSPLNELLKFLSSKDVIVYLSTDHGTVRVEKPVKINNENNKQAIRIITYSSSSSAGAGVGASFIPLTATNVSRSAAGLSLPPAGTVQPVLSAVHLAFSASVKFFGLLPSAPSDPHVLILFILR